MTTKARYYDSRLEYYESSTQERLPIGSEVVFMDDFLGFELLRSESGSPGRWATVEVNLNTAIGLAADTAHGAASLAFDADVNAEDAVLYWGDQRGINLAAGAVFECRARLSVVPTLTAQVVFGLAGDHNLDKDAVTEAAWFKFDGSAAVLCESDDTTNNNDDISAATTVATTDYHIYRIDCTVLSDVKFFIDGARVAAGTTFDMSNLTAAEAIMQPYISLDKGADAGVGTVLVDYVKCWSRRA